MVGAGLDCFSQVRLRSRQVCGPRAPAGALVLQFSGCGWTPCVHPRPPCLMKMQTLVRGNLRGEALPASISSQPLPLRVLWARRTRCRDLLGSKPSRVTGPQATLAPPGRICHCPARPPRALCFQGDSMGIGESPVGYQSPRQHFQLFPQMLGMTNRRRHTAGSTEDSVASQ